MYVYLYKRIDGDTFKKEYSLFSAPVAWLEPSKVPFRLILSLFPHLLDWFRIFFFFSRSLTLSERQEREQQLDNANDIESYLTSR